MEIKATISGEKIQSNSKAAFDLFSIQRFGEQVGEKIQYSLPEALFLLENKKMELYNSRSKKLGLKESMKIFEKIDKKFAIKYAVFQDLRQKGYIVKSALKFGAEFRVYEKGASIGDKHARWILYPVSENSVLTWHDFSAKNRVAHSTNKNLLIGVVDEENDVSYYEVKWTRP
jgi:tRNA-intron endonuclease, archaea type